MSAFGFATDPPVSEKQRRAMFAAASGHSTLGIPRKVGREFVGKDQLAPNSSIPAGLRKRAKDMQPTEFNKLKALIQKWMSEEEDEPEHAEDDEKAQTAAGRKFIIKLQMPKIDTKTGHNKGFDCSPAQDRCALDRKSVRSYDADKRLHVSRTPISKANVCEYAGREIPDYQALGLDADTKYKLWRHPDELKKGAHTFDNSPLLSRHVPMDADTHNPDIVVGSLGTDAEFEYPYLYNSLVVYTRDAIDDIESARKQELSSAYRYKADMTPGTTPEGERYDGVMRNIVGNHTALVTEGRAGSDVFVMDSKPKALNFTFARATYQF